MVDSIGTIYNDRLGYHGIPGAYLGAALDLRRGDNVGVLANLYDLALETSLHRATDGFEREVLTELAPFLGIPTPHELLDHLAPIVRSGYAEPVQVDLAVDGDLGVLSKIFDGDFEGAGRFERLLRTDRETREQFELMVGGRIVDYGDADDGVFHVRPFSDAAASLDGDYGEQVLGYLAGIDLSALGVPEHEAFKDPFQSMVLAGLAKMAGLTPAGHGWAWSDNTGPFGGRGFDVGNPLTQPGRINNTNPDYERQHLDQCAQVLRDPALTVEDKVCLLIMLIMEKSDRDILRQAEYINSLQQSQGARANQLTGKDGLNRDPNHPQAGVAGLLMPGFPGGQEDPFGGRMPKHGQDRADEDMKSSTIEIETMKMKRMIDKRSQMFDMLRQIIDRYNQSAKGIIDTMGR